MSKKSLSFQTQITPPESGYQKPKDLIVNEGDPMDSTIEQCQEIFTTRIGNVLDKVLSRMEDRIIELGLSDDFIISNKVEELKAVLLKLHEELAFRAYDIQYGLNDRGKRIVMPFSLKADDLEDLSRLEGLSWIAKKANSALLRSQNTIDDLNRIIEGAKEELADLEDKQPINHKKEKARAQKTIDTRTERVKKQKKRRHALVAKVNDLLNVDPEDAEALWLSAEDLLAFMCKNGWISENFTPEEAQKIDGLGAFVDIDKTIIQKEKPYKPKKKPNYRLKSKKPAPNRLLLALAILGGLGLGGAAIAYKKPFERRGVTESPVFYRYFDKPRTNTTSFRRGSQELSDYEVDQQYKLLEFNKLKVRLIKIYSAKDVSTEEYTKNLAEAERLQRRLQELSIELGLQIDVKANLIWPRYDFERLISNLDIDAPLNYVEDSLVENVKDVLQALFQYRRSTGFEDHFLGKYPIFRRTLEGHVRGNIVAELNVVKFKEKEVEARKISNALYRGVPGKQVGIVSDLTFELTLKGAINETIKGELSIDGIKFVPNVQPPKIEFVTNSLSEPMYIPPTIQPGVHPDDFFQIFERQARAIRRGQ